MSFNLDKEIARWKSQLYRLGDLEPEHIDELEDHLRSGIQDKAAEGMETKEAFNLTKGEVYHNPEQLAAAYRTSRIRNFWAQFELIRHLLFCLKLIKRHAGITMLNLVGLSIGIAVFFLINTYVFHEVNVDQFHEHKSNVYRLGTQFYKNGELDFSGSATFPGVGPDAVYEFPEVVNQCRLFRKYRPSTVRHEDKVFRERMFFYADSTFFDVFSYPLIAGNPKTILRKPHTVLVAEETAKKYFGDQNPMGKRITLQSYDGEEQFEVTGVFKSPRNSHLQFAFLASYSSYVSLHGAVVNTDWSWYDFFTYIQLDPRAELAALEAKLPAFIENHMGERLGATQMRFLLQRLDKIYMTSENRQEPGPVGNQGLVHLLIGIGVVILLIAWINYVNLYSAQAIKRAKEVGLRKVLGSSKGHLRQQFMVESFFMNGTAVVLGLVLFALSIPWFEQLSGLDLDVQLLAKPFFIVLILGTWLIGSLLTGFYPAWVLSSFAPIPAIKGLIKYTGKGANFRKSLIIGQFVMGVVFMAATLIILEQIRFLDRQGVGIDTGNMIVIRSPDLIDEDDVHKSKMLAFRNALKQYPQFIQTTVASELPGKGISWWAGARRLETIDTERFTLYRMGIDQYYRPMYRAKFLAGRNFSNSPPPNHVILNESAIIGMGYVSPAAALNKRLVLAGDTLIIQGVVEDFHQQTFKSSVQPAIFHFNVGHEMKFIIANAGLDIDDKLIKQVEQSFASIFPNTLCSWFMVDDYLRQKHALESSFLLTFTCFSGLALFIALLGLIGLTSFYASQRAKETSIRKLLGSSVNGLYWNLTKDMVKYILIANFIAIPFMIAFSSYWLDQFAYSISFTWAIPLLTLGATVLFSLLTISHQVLKVTFASPLVRLRYE